MVEYKSGCMVDLFINDIPYIFCTEKYNDPRDLGNMRDLDKFYGKVEIMMKNMKRLIKKSNFEKNIPPNRYESWFSKKVVKVLQIWQLILR